MDHFVYITISQVVETKAVCAAVYDFAQLSAERYELGFVKRAFEYGILYSLPVGDTAFSDLPKPLPSSSGRRIYIIGHEYHQFASLP